MWPSIRQIKTIGLAGWGRIRLVEGVVAVALAALFIGLLIVIHEAGHFLWARWGGMRVDRFSIGFGPVIYKQQIGETQFQVSALPLGGFVQVAGMDPEDGSAREDPRSYQNRSFWEKFWMVLGGPLANYVAAVVIFWGFFAVYNIEFGGPFRIVQVLPDTAAAEGGLKDGDLIVGSPQVSLTDRRSVLQAIQDSKGQTLKLHIERDGKRMEVSVQPRPAGSGYQLGIQFQGTAGNRNPLGPVAGLSKAVEEVWFQSRALLTALSGLVTRPSEAAGSLAGPIGIVQRLSQAIEAAPMAALRSVASLSVALGLFNLLPIPALDGSRLVFLIAGAIRRRPVPPKVENLVHGVGIMLLLGLMVVISWNDVVRWLAG